MGRVEVLNLDQVGYGIDGTMTRKEWRDLCLEKIYSGASEFNRWQNELNNLSVQNTGEKYNGFHFQLDVTKESLKFHWPITSLPFIVDLSGRVFSERLRFDGYAFLTGALFAGTVFEKFVSFRHASFQNDANFIAVNFYHKCSFSKTVFAKETIFDLSTFHKSAMFFEADFRDDATFIDAEFFDITDFSESVINRITFDNARFHKFISFSGSSSNDHDRLQAFGEISFCGTQFNDSVDFGNRDFRGSTDFGEYDGKPTRFQKAPLFHNCKLHQDTSFDGAEFAEPTRNNKSAALAYNTLRHAMADQQNTREEQRFLKLQFDAERATAKKG